MTASGMLVDNNLHFAGHWPLAGREVALKIKNGHDVLPVNGRDFSWDVECVRA